MRILALLSLALMLAASLYYALGLWFALDAPDMPTTLYVAMGLGVVFSLIVGVGLMALVFYSNRRGYDERASGGEHHYDR